MVRRIIRSVTRWPPARRRTRLCRTPCRTARRPLPQRLDRPGCGCGPAAPSGRGSGTSANLAMSPRTSSENRTPNFMSAPVRRRRPHPREPGRRPAGTGGAAAPFPRSPGCRGGRATRSFAELVAKMVQVLNLRGTRSACAGQSRSGWSLTPDRGSSSLTMTTASPLSPPNGWFSRSCWVHSDSARAGRRPAVRSRTAARHPPLIIRLPGPGLRCRSAAVRCGRSRAPWLPGSTDQLARLGPHTIGRACLYLKRLSDVDLDVLEELITASVDEVRSD